MLDQGLGSLELTLGFTPGPLTVNWKTTQKRRKEHQRGQAM
jgi:hypothetical protein